MNVLGEISLCLFVAVLLNGLIIGLIGKASGNTPLKAREHLKKCVVDGQCAASDSWVHITTEKLLWQIAKKGRVGPSLAYWLGMTVFPVILFPAGAKHCLRLLFTNKT